MRISRVLVGAVLAIGLAGPQAFAEEFKAGVIVAVAKDNAEIKSGSKVLAYLSKGQRVKVYHVFKEGGYALIYFTLQGKTEKGYIALKDLEAPAATAEKAELKNPFAVDDRVVVIAKEAKLKLGDETLGTLPEGTALTVKRLKGDWIGVTADIKGTPTFGWLHSRDVHYPAPTDEPKEKPPAKKEEPKDKAK